MQLLSCPVLTCPAVDGLNTSMVIVSSTAIASWTFPICITKWGSLSQAEYVTLENVFFCNEEAYKGVQFLKLPYIRDYKLSTCF